MKILRHMLLLMLCLGLLSACTKASTPVPQPKLNKIKTPTPIPSKCTPTSGTQLALSPSRFPATQGEWPMFHGDGKRSGAAPASSTGKLTLAWSYCTGGPLSSSPVVHDGIVYIGSLDETLTALDIRSGKMLWQVQSDDGFYSTPTIVNGIVYAASLGEIYAINARTGFVYWFAHVETVGGKFWSSPAVSHGLVIIGLASSLSEQPKVAGRVLAFDAKTGKVRWRTYTSLKGAPGSGVWSSPAIDEAQGIAYVATGDPDDGVQALSLRDGHLLWHWRSVKQDSADTDVGAGPTLYLDRRGKEYIAVGGKDGAIYSLDARSGRVLWHRQVGQQVFSSPAFSNGTIYALGTVHGNSAIAWALDALTGNVHWQHAISTMVYASPVISGQTLYIPIGNGFGPGDGGIEVVNAMNGRLLQYINVHGTMNSSPALLSSWLFVGAHNGNLYAFTRNP